MGPLNLDIFLHYFLFFCSLFPLSETCLCFSHILSVCSTFGEIVSTLPANCFVEFLTFLLLYHTFYFHKFSLNFLSSPLNSLMDIMSHLIFLRHYQKLCHLSLFCLWLYLLSLYLFLSVAYFGACLSY